ncbi:hypothetical protein J6590_099110, partial [Homalodisca vitripennis]
MKEQDDAIEAGKHRQIQYVRKDIVNRVAKIGSESLAYTQVSVRPCMCVSSRTLQLEQSPDVCPVLVEWSEVLIETAQVTAVKFILYKGHINTPYRVSLRLHLSCGMAGTFHFSGYCSCDAIDCR